MVCRSGHLTEQDFTAHLGDVYGIGFYMEGGPLAVTDFRADGIARGLEQGQGGGNSSTGSGTDGSGSGGTGSTGSGTGSDAPQTGVPFAVLPAMLVLAAGAGMVFLRKSKAGAR